MVGIECKNPGYIHPNIKVTRMMIETYAPAKRFNYTDIS
jgi:hypothetical protein